MGYQTQVEAAAVAAVDFGTDPIAAGQSLRSLTAVDVVAAAAAAETLLLQTW